MLGPFDWQSIPGVVMDHLRHGHEGAVKVAETKVVTVGIPPDSEVHEALGTPESVDD